MGGLFSKPSIKVEPPPPVPTIDEARQNQEAEDRLRRRRRKASTMLTGPLGDTSQVQTAAKSLLGS